jgi:DNA invertase Pin-like site-specific DNA recombinase
VNVVGYLRVSTDEQAASGLGLEAQRAAILAACEQRGWTLLRFEQDAASGRSRRKRPGLEAAIAACRSREADGLVAAKLDRLSRSVIDFAQLVEDSQRRGYSVVVLDPNIDLTTPNGRLVVGVLAHVAQWEREIIAARIRAAFEVKRLQGDERQVPVTARQRIVQLHHSGLSERGIAAALNAEGIPALGQRWHRSTVARVLRQELRTAR